MPYHRRNLRLARMHMTIGYHAAFQYWNAKATPGRTERGKARCFGTVWVQITAGTRTLGYTPVPLSGSCRYREARNFTYSRLHHSSRLRIAARFGGNGTLEPIWSPSKYVHA